MSDLRILFVGINTSSVSPSGTEMFYRILAGAGKTDFWGLGFSNIEVINRGLGYDFINNNYDIVVINHLQLSLCKNLDAAVDMCKTFRTNSITAKQMVDFSKEILSMLPQIVIRKIYNIGADYWGIRKDYLDDLSKEIDADATIYLIGEHPDYVTCKEEAPRWEFERISKNFSKEYYYDFSNKYRDRFIAGLHTIGEDYFSFTPLSLKEDAWSVVGRDYEPRIIAKKILRKNGVKVYDSGAMVFFMRGLSFLRLKPYVRPMLLSEYQRRYFDCIERSRYGFCCGMRIKSLVSKFFEISSKGSVLVCYPCKGLEDVGFIDGVNAIFCEPENIMDVYKRLSEMTMDEKQAMASAARTMVWENHSLHARIEQTKNVFSAIHRNTYKISYWKNGKFVIEENE